MEYFSIGKSILGKEIVCFKLGNNPKKRIIVQSGIHAREYITSFLVLEQIELLKDINIDATIYFVPLVNVDGVRIAIEGYGWIKNKKMRDLYSQFGKEYWLYKANARGVDLNTNFDALWGGGKSNTTTVGVANYIGKFPHSEPETRALVGLTNNVLPQLTISYHSKGEVIYLGFNQGKKELKKHKKIAKNINFDTKYRLVETKHSCGGYKDFCINKYNILAYTIEVGNDKLKHPIGLKDFESIVKKNIFTPLYCCNLR